jgi:hypothetical protein
MIRTANAFVGVAIFGAFLADRTVKTIHEKTGFENRNRGSMGDFDLRSMMTNDNADRTESVIAARIQPLL